MMFIFILSICKLLTTTVTHGGKEWETNYCEVTKVCENMHLVIFIHERNKQNKRKKQWLFK